MGPHSGYQVWQWQEFCIGRRISTLNTCYSLFAVPVSVLQNSDVALYLKEEANISFLFPVMKTLFLSHQMSIF